MNNGDILEILIQAEFGQKLRGYDPLEVDEVLDKAVAEIERLSHALSQAVERADEAEKVLEEQIGPARRNRQEAEEILLEAKEEAISIASEIQTETEDLRAAAEKEIRDAIERGRQQKNSEIADLELERKKVLDDVGIIERHIEAHRARVQGALKDLNELIGSLPSRPNLIESESESESEPEIESEPTVVMEPDLPPTELLEELRDSVGDDEQALDVFFNDDEEDPPPTSMFRRH